MQESKQYDVAILGSGLAGSILGTILAKHGFRVLLLEKGGHPRFSIGESLLPQSTMQFRIISERYGIPEVLHLSDWARISEHVSSSCGMKRMLGFVHHQRGREHDPQNCHLVVPPATPFTGESHLFREQIDLYMLEVAVRYGVTYYDHIDCDFEIDSSGVRLWAGDRKFAARYLVDATGFHSPVAKKLGLRSSPDELKTMSRTLFTHMKDVPPYSSCLSPDCLPNISAGWDDGTLHHILDGAWIWVIPFGNHAGAENRLCSVGLSLDLNKHPQKDGLSPNEEFFEFIKSYPSVAKHFQNAKAVRDWVSSGRLQFGSKSAFGERCCLMSGSYGFIDALYSRGLVSTMEVVNALAASLMGALKDENFAPERFAHIDRIQAGALRFSDSMVRRSYVSFQDFSLWNAWIRVWVFSKFYSDLRMNRAWLNYDSTGDLSHLERLERDSEPGTACPGVPEIQRFIDAAGAVVDRVEKGELTAQAGGAEIIGLFERNADIMPPVYDWSDANARHLDITPEAMKKMFGWGKGESPAALREALFDFDPAKLLEPLSQGERI